LRRPILFALAVGIVAASALPAWSASDPSRSKQWGLSRIHADTAWATTKGAGVTIAVVDTGIDLNHPDLQSKIAGHYTCIGGSCTSGGNDDNGHGSHVAGIAAAATGNGVGIAGVAPSAKLMAVKVLKSDGSGKCSDIAVGIRFAADHGARVINLSLGPELGLLDLLLGNGCIDTLESAAAYAYNKGDVVVIAAGNDGLGSLYSSSALEVVGATGPHDEVASYSNTGADVYAPGGDASGSCSASSCIYSTWINGYQVEQGTSMATPHVAGVAALLLSQGYSNTQAVKRINSTADSVNGILRLNAARAVGPPPSPSSTPTKQASLSATASPSSTHSSTSNQASASPTPSQKQSKSSAPKVLGVGPTEKPSTVSQAAGAPSPAAHSSRALPIGIAVAVLVVAFVAATRYFARRRTA
jgi:subtilisin family serine protease